MAAPTRPVPPLRLFHAYVVEQMVLGDEEEEDEDEQVELDAGGSADAITDEVEEGMTCNETGRCSDDDKELEKDVLLDDDVVVAVGTTTTQGMEEEEGEEDAAAAALVAGDGCSD